MNLSSKNEPVASLPVIAKQLSKKLPLSSGVYLFRDKKGKVLYIGRATSLRRRVLEYLNRKGNLDFRLQEMIGLARNIKYIKTENVLEAVILEANLIKKYIPKYNIRERDNRSFIYVAIYKGDFPRPIITRGRELQKFSTGDNYIFGPYQSWSLVKNALRIIRRVFPYSTCRPFSGKPCFDYQIGLCPGICIGKISKEDYQKNIKNLILLLSGQKKKLLKKLQKENPEKIKTLKHVSDVSLISKEELDLASNINRIEGYDISHFSGRETFGSMVVFTAGRAKTDQYRLFKIKKAPLNDDLRALEEVILRRFNHPEWQFPDLILIDGGKPQVDFIFRVLKNCHINTPIIGISKFKGDELVFPAKTKKSLKELSISIKGTLLRVREEAHRFALKSSRRLRIKSSAFFDKLPLPIQKSGGKNPKIFFFPKR